MNYMEVKDWESTLCSLLNESKLCLKRLFSGPIQIIPWLYLSKRFLLNQLIINTQKMIHIYTCRMALRFSKFGHVINYNYEPKYSSTHFESVVNFQDDGCNSQFYKELFNVMMTLCNDIGDILLFMDKNSKILLLTPASHSTFISASYEMFEILKKMKKYLTSLESTGSEIYTNHSLHKCWRPFQKHWLNVQDCMVLIMDYLKLFCDSRLTKYLHECVFLLYDLCYITYSKCRNILFQILSIKGTTSDRVFCEIMEMSNITRTVPAINSESTIQTIYTIYSLVKCMETISFGTMFYLQFLSCDRVPDSEINDKITSIISIIDEKICSSYTAIHELKQCVEEILWTENNENDSDSSDDDEIHELDHFL